QPAFDAFALSRLARAPKHDLRKARKRRGGGLVMRESVRGIQEVLLETCLAFREIQHELAEAAPRATLQCDAGEAKGGQVLRGELRDVAQFAGRGLLERQELPIQDLVLAELR